MGCESMRWACGGRIVVHNTPEFVVNERVVGNERAMDAEYLPILRYKND